MASIEELRKKYAPKTKPEKTAAELLAEKYAPKNTAAREFTPPPVTFAPPEETKSPYGNVPRHQVRGVPVNQRTEPMQDRARMTRDNYRDSLERKIEAEAKKNAAAADRMEKTFGGGNVDLRNRPKVANPDGSYSTLDSEWVTADFGGKTAAIHYTPIKNGTRLESDAVQKYLSGLINRAENAESLLRLDKPENGGMGILLRVNPNYSRMLYDRENRWGQKLHEAQETYYGKQGELEDRRGNLDGVHVRAEEGRVGNALKGIGMTTPASLEWLGENARQMKQNAIAQQNTGLNEQFDMAINHLTNMRNLHGENDPRTIEAKAKADAIRAQIQAFRASPERATDINSRAGQLMQQAQGYQEKALEGTTGLERMLGESLISVGQNAAKLPLGPAALALMGAEAAAGKSFELSQQGVNASEAMGRGIVSGGIEAATEKMGIDNLFDIIKTGGKSALKNLLKQAGVEGTEEGFSYVFNLLADKLAKDPQAKFSLPEMLEQIAAGAVSGLIFGGAGTAIDRIGRIGQPKAAEAEPPRTPAPGQSSLTINDNPDERTRELQRIIAERQEEKRQEAIDRNIEQEAEREARKNVPQLKGIPVNDAYRAREDYRQRQAEPNPLQKDDAALSEQIRQLEELAQRSAKAAEKAEADAARLDAETESARAAAKEKGGAYYAEAAEKKNAAETARKAAAEGRRQAEEAEKKLAGLRKVSEERDKIRPRLALEAREQQLRDAEARLAQAEGPAAKYFAQREVDALRESVADLKKPNRAPAQKAEAPAADGRETMQSRIDELTEIIGKSKDKAEVAAATEERSYYEQQLQHREALEVTREGLKGKEAELRQLKKDPQKNAGRIRDLEQELRLDREALGMREAKPAPKTEKKPLTGIEAEREKLKTAVPGSLTDTEARERIRAMEQANAMSKEVRDAKKAYDDLMKKKAGTAEEQAQLNYDRAKAKEALDKKQAEMDALIKAIKTPSNTEKVKELMAAAQQQKEETHERADVPDGKRKRDAGQRAGKQAGQLAESTGRAEGRSLEETRKREAEGRRSGPEDLREKVSTRSLGITQGSEEKTLSLLDPRRYNRALKAAADKVKKLTGKDVQFYNGEMRVAINGREHTVNGCYMPDGRIYVQADGLNDPEKIALHESMHALIADDPGLLKKAERAIRQAMPEETFREMYRAYERGLGDMGYDALIEEIVCDAFGGINTWAVKAGDWQQTIREAASAKTQEAETKPVSRRGPPDREARLEAQAAKEREASMSDLKRLQEQLRNGEIDEDEFDELYDAIATDPGMQERFSMTEPIEETDRLIAWHNMSVDALESAADLGGLAMPSFAVKPADMSHESYGECSILARKESIDPRENKDQMIYGGDAWTPVFPEVAYKPNEKVIASAEKKVDDLIGPETRKQLSHMGYDAENIADKLRHYSGNIRKAFGNDRALQLAHLKSMGENIALKTKEEKAGKRSGHPKEIIQAIAEEFGANRLHDIRMGGVRLFDDKPEIARRMLEIVNNFYEKKIGKKDLFEDMMFGDFDRITADAAQYARNGAKQILDVNAAEKAIDEKLDQTKYEEWLDGLFDGLIEKRGIRNNKELFTPSGNRRSWDAIHMDFNLANIVKSMKGQARQGRTQALSGPASVKGAALKAYKDIEEVRKDTGRLRKDKEYGIAKYNEFASKVKDICDRMLEGTKNQYADVFDMTEALAETLGKTKTKSGIKRYMEREFGPYYNVYEGIENDVYELYRTANEIPMEYFESKLYRAYPLSEAAAIVVPDDTRKSLIRKLEEAGANVKTYKAGDEADRLRTVNSVDGVRFSVTAEQDKEYMEAAETGDEGTARRMVRDAAKQAGAITNQRGIPLHLYHGTPSFGFTSFAGDIFTTDSPGIAAGYTKNKGHARKRRLSDTYTPDDGTDETLIKNAKRVTDWTLRKITDQDRAERTAEVKEQAELLKKKVNSMEDPTEYLFSIGMTDEVNGAIWGALGFPETVVEALEDDGMSYESTRDMIEREARDLDRYKKTAYDFIVENHDKIKGSPAEELGNIIRGFELGDLAIDAAGMVKLYDPEKYLISSNGSAVEKESARDYIEQAKDIGAYDLYGFAGDNPLVIDTNGAFWANVRVPEWGEKTFTTDDIIRKAKEKGFTSVQFNDIYDMSMNNYATNEKSNVYVFFDSNDVRSADPFTYDDAGKIIPLSERFNRENNDIRFSVTDSEGNELSEQQQEFFKDSKVRDKYGNLIPVYHGTKSGRFALFDPKKSDDKISLFFTSKKALAQTYSGSEAEYIAEKGDGTPRASKKMTTAGKWEELKNFAKRTDPNGNSIEFGREWVVVWNKNGLYPGRPVRIFSGNSANDKAGAEKLIQDPDKQKVEQRRTVTANFRKNYFKESEIGEATDEVMLALKGILPEDEQNFNFKVYLNMKNPLVIDGRGAPWHNVEGKTTRQWANEAKRTGHDGVILKNIRDRGGADAQKKPEMNNESNPWDGVDLSEDMLPDENKNDEAEPDSPADVYIAFRPNQVKSVANRNPTDDPDIRFSETGQNTEREKATENLSAKAKKHLERTENAMGKAIVRALNLPYYISTEELLEPIQRMTGEYLSTGVITREARDEAFRTAYESGFTKAKEWYDGHKADADELKKLTVHVEGDALEAVPNHDWAKNRMEGILGISFDSGMSVDEAYAKMHEKDPELFPDDIRHPADKLKRLMGAANNLRRTAKTIADREGKNADLYKKVDRGEFEAAVDDNLYELQAVKRISEERKKASQIAEYRPDPADIMAVSRAYKDTQRAAERAMAKELLSAQDKELLNLALRNDINLDEVPDDGHYNLRGIRNVYEAKREHQKYAAMFDKNRAARKAQRRQKAAHLLEKAGEIVDKKAELMYDRETAERIIRDIVKDPEAAEEIIDTYFRPIHAHEAEKQRYLNRERKLIEELNLSRKARKGDAVSEAHAVQLVGEAEDNIRFLEKHPRIEKRDGMTIEEWRNVLADMWASSPSLDKAKIRNAVQTFTKFYDAAFKAMNEARVRNGYEPINYRQGYFPHFQSEDDGILSAFGRAMGIDTKPDTLPTAINGMTPSFKPGIRWVGNTLPRLGFDTTYDAVEGFDRYIEGVADVIYHTDDLQDLRALASEIRYRSTDEGIRERVDEIRASSLAEEDKENRIDKLYEKAKFELSTFVTWLDEYTNLLANKKSKYDRTVEHLLGRRVYNLFKWLNNNVAGSMVVVNPASWLTNYIPLTQAMGSIGYTGVLKGMAETIQGQKDSDKLWNESDFLTNRRGSDRLALTSTEEWSKKMGHPMELIDSFVAESIVRARMDQNLKRGMSRADALEEAGDFTGGLMADRSKGAVPTIFGATNPLFKTFTQFQVEVNNQLSYMLKDLPRDKRDKGAKAIAMALLRMFLGAWVFDELYEFVIGRRPAFDPLSVFNDTIGDATGYKLPNMVDASIALAKGEDIDFTTDKKDAFGTVWNLRGNILQDMPFFGGFLEGGRVPISSAKPNWEQLGKAIGRTGWDWKKRLQVGGKELMKPLSYMVLPFGGGQIKKILETIDATARGGSYVYTDEGEKELQYPVYNDSLIRAAASLAKGAAFGKTSLKTGQNWVKNGFKSFGVKETAAYDAMREAGAKGEDAYELLLRMKETDKTEDRSAIANKRLELLASDLNGEAKAVAYYAMFASEDEKDFIFEPLATMGEDLWPAAEALLKIHDVDADTTDRPLKSNEKRDVLINTRMPDRTKQMIYREKISDSRDEDIELFRKAGLGMNDFLKAQNAYTEINGKDLKAGEKATELARWIRKQSYTPAQREAVEEAFKVYSMVPAKAERYESMVDAGISDDKAARLTEDLGKLKPQAGSSTVSSTQKLRVIVDSGLTEAETMSAIQATVTESEYEKIEIAASKGITPRAWTSFREALKRHDTNGNGHYDQKELRATLDSMGGKGSLDALLGGKAVSLTTAQKAVLWQLMSNSKSAKNNPYSPKIGAEVIRLKTKEEPGTSNTALLEALLGKKR